MVYPILDNDFCRHIMKGHDFRPCVVFNPLLLGLLGILGG